ncbi:hypothetical protein [Pseudoroseicyclus sp. CXY001]|uniref:hypothetical protein n=1 Tax=Pseudoroseicyclus sp. CXY001 TaxID=3242492 RepID=UPI00358DCC47
MAYLDGRFYSLTGDNFIDMMTHGYCWDVPSGSSISLSLSEAPSFDWDEIFWIQWTYIDLYAEIDQYVDVRLTFRGLFPDAENAQDYGADINIAFDVGDYVSWFPTFTGVYSTVSLPQPGRPELGNIFLNALSPMGTIDLETKGGLGYFVVLQEIANTLGLKHPDEYGFSGRPTFGALGLEEFDDTLYTVMSKNFDYGDDGEGGGASNPGTLMAYDILALQYIYGPNMASNAGDDWYELSRDRVFESIWDASGMDAIDAREAGEGWYITLPDMPMSELVDTKVGYAKPLADSGAARPTDMYWLLGDFENVYGSQFADVVNANAFDNLIKGMGGRDKLYGFSGDDLINGGPDADEIYGGDGADVLAGYTGWDEIYGAEGDDLLLGGDGADALDAGDGDDRVNGGPGGDTIFGHQGDDLLNGSYGKDWINGGTGNDFINGAADKDVLYGAGGHDKVVGGQGNDMIRGGAGSDTLRGNIGSDQLDGGNGHDFLRGDGGADKLTGGLGIDTLMGGADNDKFVFISTDDSRGNVVAADKILDFEKGDKIDLHWIDASEIREGNNTFVFSGTGALGTDSYGEVVYRQIDLAGSKDDYTMVYLDTDSDKAPEMAIYLAGLIDLTASDFIL